MKELLEKPENFPTFVTVHIRTYKFRKEIRIWHQWN